MRCIDDTSYVMVGAELVHVLSRHHPSESCAMTEIDGLHTPFGGVVVSAPRLFAYLCGDASFCSASEDEYHTLFSLSEHVSEVTIIESAESLSVVYSLAHNYHGCESQVVLFEYFC